MRLGVLTAPFPELGARWAASTRFSVPGGGGVAGRLDRARSGQPSRPRPVRPGLGRGGACLFGRYAVMLSALAYHDNPLHPDPPASSRAFIGRNPELRVTANSPKPRSARSARRARRGARDGPDRGELPEVRLAPRWPPRQPRLLSGSGRSTWGATGGIANASNMTRTRCTRTRTEARPTMTAFDRSERPDTGETLAEAVVHEPPVPEPEPPGPGPIPPSPEPRLPVPPSPDPIPTSS